MSSGMTDCISPKEFIIVCPQHEVKQVQVHYDGIGNCHGIQGSGSGGSGNDGGGSGDGGDD